MSPPASISGLCRGAALAILCGVGRPALAQDPVPAHETFTIVSRRLGEPRVINVYVPSPARVARRPVGVLYMLDGGLAEDFPRVANTLDSLIGLGAIPPMLVVGIENTQRRRDLTGPTTVATDSAIAPRVGGSVLFRRFVAEELMPEVRRRYHPRGETAIVGESLAGLFVVETFLLEPKLFERYIAIDPSIWWNGGQLVRNAGRHLTALGGRRRTLYLNSSSVPEMATGVAALAETIRATAPRRLTWWYEPRPDLEHGTIFRAAGPGALVEALK